jgi:hypothetical protein
MAEPEAEVRRMRELSCSGLWNVHSLQGMHDRCPGKQRNKITVREGEIQYLLCDRSASIIDLRVFTIK